VENEKKCNRCGKCCFYPTGKNNEDGSVELKACRFLLEVAPGVFHCRVYSDRLGRIVGRDSLGNVYRCISYNALASKIMGCPLNAVYNNGSVSDVRITEREVQILTRKKAKQK
jgi:hypothetical protein